MPVFDPIKPYNQFYLEVSSIHTLYVEEVGNPFGIPILFLHGGPGSGLDPVHRQFFDPKKFRVILFDQRGCGKSTPYAEIKDNTTAHLIDDIEMIRKKLNIEKWHVFGGSWGSFLSLAYAESFPKNVLSLTLRGLFLGRKEEIEFFYQKGASFIYPEEFEKFVSILSVDEKKNVISSFYQRLTSNDKTIESQAAKHWTIWEASCLKLINTQNSIADFAKDERLLSLAKIEAHYFNHGCFIKQNQLIENVDKIEKIPTFLVHGRYDLVCPFENAYLLKKAMPNLELHISKTSGHSAMEEETLAVLLKRLSDL
jgi:proline iminopeptidase